MSAAHEYHGRAFGRAGRKDGKLTKGQPRPVTHKRLEKLLHPDASSGGEVKAAPARPVASSRIPERAFPNIAVPGRKRGEIKPAHEGRKEGRHDSLPDVA